jgi:hypothetical protein
MNERSNNLIPGKFVSERKAESSRIVAADADFPLT